MQTHPLKLVTIIGEALARESLKKLLSESGARGRRSGDIQEFANIQIEVIVQPAVAEQLLMRLERDFFPRFAMVAYETDIRVIRREKF